MHKKMKEGKENASLITTRRLCTLPPTLPLTLPLTSHTSLVLRGIRRGNQSGAIVVAAHTLDTVTQDRIMSAVLETPTSTLYVLSRSLVFTAPRD